MKTGPTENPDVFVSGVKYDGSGKPVAIALYKNESHWLVDEGELRALVRGATPNLSWLVGVELLS